MNDFTNKLRNFIQSNLSTPDKPSHLDCGEPQPDGAVENGVTYFGYEAEKNYLSSDLDSNDIHNILVTGRVVRRCQDGEGTQSMVDEATDYIIGRLKAMNFKCSQRDITIDENVRKVYISARAKYNYISNEFVR